jgi:hypothetical protein
MGVSCPTIYLNPVDMAECDTVACTYLEVHLLDRLLESIAGIRTSIISSVPNGYCPRVVGCLACCGAVLLRVQYFVFKVV